MFATKTNADNIVGQHRLLKRIDSFFEADRVAHAFLFYGEKGIGKKTIAKYIAGKLLCKGQNKPCGVCPACKRMETDNHPDFIWVQPKRRNILVDDIRTLIAQLSVQAYEGGYKVAVIEQAEMMTDQAQNALLKTLEEPTQRTVLLLLAENTQMMLKTVLSRCVVMRIPPLALPEMEQVLQKNGVPQQQLGILAHQAMGVPGKAMEHIQHEEGRKAAVSLLLAQFMPQPRNVVADAATLLRIPNWLAVWQSALRDLLLGAQGNTDFINIDFKAEIEKACTQCSYRKLLRVYDILIETGRKIEQNVAASTCCEVMLLGIAEVVV